jgi:hypothetical protein
MKDDKLFLARARVLHSTGGMGMRLISGDIEAQPTSAAGGGIGVLNGELAPGPKAQAENKDISNLEPRLER